MKSNTVRPNYRKLVLQLLAGAVFGGVMSLGASRYLAPLLGRGLGAGAFALAGVGLVYAMMGLFVGLGLVFPGLGAKMLNVADRDDLADQRAILTGGAVTSTVLGVALILLALSGPAGPVPGLLGVGALGFAIVLMTVVTLLHWPRYDELMRGLSLEATGWMAGLLLPLLSLWAALAHMGQGPAIDPLGLIALLMGAQLLGTFIATGRRGMLMPS